MKLSQFFNKPSKWYQGDFSNKYHVDNIADTLCYCPIGAYCKLRGISPDEPLKGGNYTIMEIKTPPTLAKIYDVLPKKYKTATEYRTKQECIAVYNDAPTTTFKKIQKLLVKAGV